MTLQVKIKKIDKHLMTLQAKKKKIDKRLMTLQAKKNHPLTTLAGGKKFA